MRLWSRCWTLFESAIAVISNSKQIPLLAVCLGIVEALLITSTLGLFAYGYPDATRKSLWEEGGRNGFNSDPKLRIYFYANYKQPPEIPYIWSQQFTDFNLSVVVLTFGIFVLRIVLMYWGIMRNWTQLILQCLVLPFWVLSLVAQQSSDYSDSEHLSRSPWYLTNTCDLVKPRNRGFCQVAQASFAMTTVVTCFYACCIWRVLAYEGFDCLLNQCRTGTQSIHQSQLTSRFLEEGTSELGRSAEETPFMMALDEM